MLPLIKKIAAVCFIVIITLFFLEIAVRIFAPQNISPVIGELDETLGYTLKANVHAIHKTSEFDTVVHTSSMGYRSPEISYEKENKTRILFLGDSFTYGWGVNEEERFTDIVSENLGYEMLNAGVPGYKLSNILAYYENEGYKYHPDIVVLLYNVRTGVANINSAEYAVVNGTLVRTSLYTSSLKNKIKEITTKIPGYSFVMQHSQLFALFRNVVVGILNNHVAPTTDCTILADTWLSETKEREVLLVQELYNKIQEYNTTFVLVINHFPLCSFDTLFADFEDATAVPHILNLDQNFGTETEEYYYPYDKHWNKEGHARAAEEFMVYMNSTLSSY